MVLSLVNATIKNIDPKMISQMIKIIVITTIKMLTVFFPHKTIHLSVAAKFFDATKRCQH